MELLIIGLIKVFDNVIGTVKNILIYQRYARTLPPLKQLLVAEGGEMNGVFS